jgi:hypothetical protein
MRISKRDAHDLPAISVEGLPAVSLEGLPAVSLEGPCFKSIKAKLARRQCGGLVRRAAGGVWGYSKGRIPYLEPCTLRLRPQYRCGLEKSAMPSLDWHRQTR